MNQDQIKNLVEIVGISAIVASLIFVGLELRQSQQIAIASQYQERSKTGAEFNYRVLESEWKLEQRAEKMAGRIESSSWLPSEFEKNWLEGKTPIDLAKSEAWAMVNLYIFDNYHFQYESGFMTEEAWLSQKSRLRSVLATEPLSRDQIVNSGDRWGRGFVELCLEIIADIDED